MRRAIKFILLTAAVTVVSLPRPARAEGFINPWAGVVFGNDTIENTVGSFGVSAGAAGTLAGFELNLGYAPNPFDENIDNSELDLMGDVLIGPMVGSGGYGIRPFVIGGLGLIRTTLEGLEDTNDFGFNVGAGVSGYFSRHVGLRADVRYFRTINAEEPEGLDDLNIDLGEFHFWRAQIGLTIH
jgi:hypothetical protein